MTQRLGVVESTPALMSQNQKSKDPKGPFVIGAIIGGPKFLVSQGHSRSPDPPWAQSRSEGPVVLEHPDSLGWNQV